MKKYNLLLVVILLGIISFNSCEEGLNFDINTTIKKNINADIQEGLKSTDALNAFSFYTVDSLNITDNEKIQSNLDKFKDLEITKITCTLTGIPENESIPELTIIIPEAHLNISLIDISVNNNAIALDVSPELLDALATFLYLNHIVTIQISGFSTYAPMILGVELGFESTIITEL